MSTHEQEGRRDGGVPNTFGNKVAWKWSRAMPRSLKTSKFLCLLYVLRTMASASGELRFPDGKPIRIQDIAAATGCREQDARRYLEAGRRAGVVLVGERRRGTPTLYAVAAEAWPDWKVAEDYLRGTARPRQEEEPAPSSGHGGTNSDERGSVHSGTEEFGPQRPELEPSGEEPGQSTVDRWGSDHGGPLGSVHGGPDNSGVTQGVTHVMAEVGSQPQVVGGSAAKSDHSSENQDQAAEEEFGRCQACQVPLVRPGRTHCPLHTAKQPGHGKRQAGRARAIQAPLMTVVQGDAAVPQQAAEAPQAPASKIPNPWAPERTCGCGRAHRTGASTCPLCQELAREETARLAAAHQEVS